MRMPRRRRITAGLALLVTAVLTVGAVLAGGGAHPVRAAHVGVVVARSAPGTRFDAGRAYALVREQLAYGPRPAGSAAQRRVAELLVRKLPAAGFEPVPGGLRNIVGGLPGSGPAIVVAAHYDTTPVPGYLGANNSAAGVAAVVELARDLRRQSTPRGAPPIRFALFDGEEAPAGFSDFLNEGLRGSRAYAAAHASQTREVIVLDFIALRNELLPREQASDELLWGRLRGAARRVRASRLFPDSVAAEVFDDHTPFLRAGIPAIDLIDFDYACWQKPCDNLSQVSQRNLGAVGDSVLELIRAERRRLAAG